MTANEMTPTGDQPAVQAPRDLHAEYKMDPQDPRHGMTLPIYAFSVDGHPLVVEFGGTRLVRAEVVWGLG